MKRPDHGTAVTRRVGTIHLPEPTPAAGNE
jgi:hypothetical protein